MWMYARVVDRTGDILAAAEGEVKEDDDLIELIRQALNRFRQTKPGHSLMVDVGRDSITIEVGMAGLANA